MNKIYLQYYNKDINKFNLRVKDKMGVHLIGEVCIRIMIQVQIYLIGKILINLLDTEYDYQFYQIDNF